MRDQMKFVNHLGEEIEFGKGNILINENDFRNYNWEYSLKNDIITGFTKKTTEKKLPVIVYGEKARETVNKIFEITEKDAIANHPGKMYIGDYYIDGFIIAGDYSGYTKQNSITISLKFVTKGNVWIKQQTKQFFPQTQLFSSSGLDFPTDFDFDFASSITGTVSWNIEHYAPSHFLMTVYGPCVDPRILVNGYPYQIFTVLESNEYLIIDSRNNTVTKYLANGTTANLYNSRQFTPSVFEKIPSGQIAFYWSGKFGFDITLYMERSEPRW